jgi:hypothetical protein
VKKRIRDNLPRSFPEAEKAAFLADVEKTTAVIEAMELYVGFLGRKSFDRVFPP